MYNYYVCLHVNKNGTISTAKQSASEDKQFFDWQFNSRSEPLKTPQLED